MNLDVEQKIKALLEKLKVHTEDIESLKDENPAAYHAVLHLLHSLKDMLQDQIKNKENEDYSLKGKYDDEALDHSWDDTYSDFKDDERDDFSGETEDKEDDGEINKEEDDSYSYDRDYNEDEDDDDEDEDEDDDEDEDEDDDEDDDRYDDEDDDELDEYDRDHLQKLHEQNELWEILHHLRQHPDYHSHVVIDEEKMRKLQHLRRPIDHLFENNNI